jgi:small subunit ribosomal protein S6
MTRTYEMVYVVDPRLSEDETTKLHEEHKRLITTGGGKITHEQDWGRRKLAYAIQKLNEGRYLYLRLDVDGKNPLPEVEYRMRQNEQILRYLSVRTDLDDLPPPRQRGDDEQTEAAGAGEGS